MANYSPRFLSFVSHVMIWHNDRLRTKFANEAQSVFPLLFIRSVPSRAFDPLSSGGALARAEVITVISGCDVKQGDMAGGLLLTGSGDKSQAAKISCRSPASPEYSPEFRRIDPPSCGRCFWSNPPRDDLFWLLPCSISRHLHDPKAARLCWLVPCFLCPAAACLWEILFQPLLSLCPHLFFSLF